LINVGGVAHRLHDISFPFLPYTPFLPRQVDAVVVGADRVVATGDSANKIGT